MDFVPQSWPHQNKGRGPPGLRHYLLISRPSAEPSIRAFLSGSCSKTPHIFPSAPPVPCASCSSRSVSSFYFVHVKVLFFFLKKSLFVTSSGVCCTLHFHSHSVPSFPAQCLEETKWQRKIPLKKGANISLVLLLSKIRNSYQRDQVWSGFFLLFWCFS